MNSIIKIFFGPQTGRSLIIDGHPVDALTLDVALSMESGHVQIGVTTTHPITHSPAKFQIRLAATGEPENLINAILLEPFAPPGRDLLLTINNREDWQKLVIHIQKLAIKLNDVEAPFS